MGSFRITWYLATFLTFCCFIEAQNLSDENISNLAHENEETTLIEATDIPTTEMSTTIKNGSSIISNISVGITRPVAAVTHFETISSCGSFSSLPSAN